MMTLTPAYGRDYRSKKHALADFMDDADFILNDFGSPYDGKPVNRSDLIGTETEVKIRYDKLRKVCVVKV